MRSSLFIIASFVLVACSGGTTSSSSGSGGAQQSALDGTWDITAAGPDAIGTSSMTISGSTINGSIGTDDNDAISNDGTTCAGHTENKFQITLNGDTASALFTFTTTYSPSSCSEPSNSTSTLTASRAAGSNPGTGTAFDGKWVINDADNKPFAAVTILNLVVQAWENAEDRDSNRAPTLTAQIANGASTTQTNDRDLTFAARRR